jgi:hypothetical protein
MYKKRLAGYSALGGFQNSAWPFPASKNKDYRVGPGLAWIAVNSNQSTQVPTTAR